ncbi:hypothetical protein LIT25_25335 [Bacillus sp. F19]|nr:hypothetical protein LIT25_25335 [Bacillus sp. F19]
MRDCSPSKSLTFARYSRLDEESGIEALHSVTKQNLEHTQRMIHYNIAHQIELYRFSSSLVPLATHPDVKWDFLTTFRDNLKEIGDLVRKNSFRTKNSYF